jgi:hypothetical protein
MRSRPASDCDKVPTSRACDSAGPVPEASADHGASPADGAHPAAAADEPLQDKPTAQTEGARALAAPDDPIAAHRTAEGTVEGPVAVLLRDDSLPRYMPSRNNPVPASGQRVYILDSSKCVCASVAPPTAQTLILDRVLFLSHKYAMQRML